ncbi:carboxylesterase family protein [Marinilabilia rubra]|uniref:Phospholipase n=1 Tax=Marinilabilia rubra TaxID=2162893 RepID=A0A2U2B7E7_9BACT|nr:alpha/beta hydrolase-fold protein [Marinilabilia rubra]PWD98964.1 phospholipase [Marinilabilia rubra]
MKTQKIKQLGFLFLILFFSIVVMACDEKDVASLLENEEIEEETELVEETGSLEATDDEALYGYNAMEYRNSKYTYPLPVRLYTPEGYQEGEKYPLVIFLHGAGRRGSDNVSQIKDMTGALAFVKSEVQEKHPSFVLAPQCPENQLWVGRSKSGDGRAKSLDDVNLSSSYLMLMDLLETIPEQYGIDSTRIYLTGQSMGGTGTWFIALSNPDKFAAIAPVCGWSFPSEVSVIADMPVWAFHGADDKTILPKGSRDMVQALQEAGNTKVKYTEYPNVGHESWYKAYKEAGLIEWVFSQKRE